MEPERNEDLTVGLANIAGEIGADVVRGELRFPSDTNGWVESTFGPAGTYTIDRAQIAQAVQCRPRNMAQVQGSTWRDRP